MKLATLTIIILIVIISCNQDNSKHFNNENKKSTSDTSYHALIDDFRKFRDVVYHHEVRNTKLFFQFPILNYNNEIWKWVLTEKEKDKKEIKSDTIIPFEEKDFDKYFDRLFPKEFITGILKIKSDSLFTNGNFKTEVFIKQKGISFNISSSYDKNSNSITISLNFRKEFKDENGDDLDDEESSIIYQFTISKDNHLLFKDIRMAG